MSDSSAGTVYLGFKLDDADFLTQMAELSSEASKIMRKGLSDSVKMPANMLDLSSLRKEFDRLGASLGDALKDQTQAIDSIADVVYNSLQKSVEEGLAEGARVGTAQVSERLGNIFQTKKIKVDLDLPQLERMLQIYSDRWTAVDNQRIAQAQKVKQIQEELARSSAIGLGTEKLEGQLTAAQKKLTDLKLAAEQADQQVVTLERTIAGMQAPKLDMTKEIVAPIAEGTAQFKQLGAEGQRAAKAIAAPVAAGSAQFKKLGTEGQRAGKTITQSMRQASESTHGVNQATSAAGQGFKKLFRVGMAMMGIRSVMLGVRRATRSVMDQMQRMSGSNAGLAKSLNGITAATDQLKGAFSAMVVPIVQAVLPVLQKVVEYAVKAFNAVAALIAGLFGFKKVMVVAGSTKTFTNEVGSAQKGVDKLKRSLAGFDELEVLSKPTSSGGGGGGGGADPGTLWEEVDVPISGWQAELKKLFDEFKNSKIFGNFEKAAIKAWGNIKTSASNAWTKIKTSWDENSPRIIDSFLNLGSNFVESVANWATYIWLPMKSGAISAFLEIGGELISSLLLLGADLMELVDAIFSPFFESINAFWDAHGLDISEKITGTWNGITESVTGILNGLADIYHQVFGGLAEWFKENSGEIKGMLTKTWETIWGIIEPIWTAVERVGRTIFGALSDFFHEIAPKIKDVVVGAVNAAWRIIKPIWEGMLAVARTIFGALKLFWETWGGTISAFFSGMWDSIKSIFGGLLDFLAGVFTGDWERIWEGIKSIFKGIWDGIKTIFITPINWMIDGLNFFIRQLNKIKIPDWVPLVGGKGINIKEINRIELARGGIVDQPTLAMVGEAGQEAVMPLENNTGWITKLARQIAEEGGAGGGGNEVHLTQPIYIGTDNLADIIESIIDREGRLRNAPVF